MDPDGQALVHTVVEAEKLAFADRVQYYGDPDFGEDSDSYRILLSLASSRAGVTAPIWVSRMMPLRSTK